MEKFEKKVRAATGELGKEKQELAGVVVSARSRRFNYDNSFGFKGLGADSPPIDLESTFWAASCTKLLTTIAAMQILEQGKVTLDEDISRILPEFKDPQILVRVEDGKPTLVPAKNKITLRHLLTHSSGLGYTVMSPNLMAYAEATGQQAKMTAPTVNEKYNWPLLFEPGEDFHYGQSVDWAGQVVERISGMRLGDYLAKYVFAPIGVQQSTFHPSRDPAVESNLVEMLLRATPGDSTLTTTTMFDRKAEWEDMGGEGIYTNPTNYVKVLVSITRNDEKILKKESVEQMFTPQLKDPSHLMKHISALLEPGIIAQLMGALPGETAINWGLGGLLSLEEVPGRRRKGSMSWSGLPNLFWWMDPVSESCGCWATNIIPTGDVKSAAMYKEFEEAVYEELTRSKSSRI
ncbi:beta-lactamase [Eremomyces bilateralis CBS 781.70]|uniref:Beta-lactamase n=1 Tax=Eremomyces bilateralis CBS 781.70 TaxID=1392243 RepID=A0A6G1FX44_9PEZI|nr:beta-lactamase [Eremomyces bilateralis CBS 781.70]KAF1810236.1 beta-lactamase [Eremomyces bilateralis CBS 781.70]